jgi:hypothetical protein
MGHSDSSGTGTQNPRSGHSNSSKSVNDKYSLFPTANHPPRVSSKPLQQQAHQRIPSFSNRRSLSLDESSRPHGVARMPFSRPGDAQLPRLQKVPANRVTVTKPDGQDRTCMSLGHRRLSKANEPEAQAPKILSYKPRISEDAGHGRSSSAPDDMRAELRTRKPTGLAQMTNAALASSAKAVGITLTTAPLVDQHSKIHQHDVRGATRDCRNHFLFHLETWIHCQPWTLITAVHIALLFHRAPGDRTLQQSGPTPSLSLLLSSRLLLWIQAGDLTFR